MLDQKDVVKWKVGDKFKVINPLKDNLFNVHENEVLTVLKLKPDYIDIGNHFDTRYYLWFRHTEDQISCQYVSKDNIRPLTKLERALI